MQNDPSDKIALVYTAGPEWDGHEDAPTWLYTFSPQFEIGKNWELIIEEYAYLQKHKAPEHTLDAGLAYFVTKNSKADFFTGAGLTGDASKYFISAGVSFRF